MTTSGRSALDISRRDIARLLGATALAGAAPRAAYAAPKTGGAINVATVGEPPTLDPMESPADVVGMIAQHMFETLYTWGRAGGSSPCSRPATP